MLIKSNVEFHTWEFNWHVSYVLSVHVCTTRRCVSVTDYCLRSTCAGYVCIAFVLLSLYAVGVCVRLHF